MLVFNYTHWNIVPRKPKPKPNKPFSAYDWGVCFFFLSLPAGLASTQSAQVQGVKIAHGRAVAGSSDEVQEFLCFWHKLHPISLTNLIFISFFFFKEEESVTTTDFTCRGLEPFSNGSVSVTSFTMSKYNSTVLKNSSGCDFKTKSASKCRLC